MAKKTTMAELAKHAGVDVSTVSRALNDSPLVKENTKAHILKIASELGYAVNASARNLRRQASEAIALVIPMDPNSGQTISDPFFLEMVGAVSHAASKAGYDLIVSIPTNDNEIAERRLLMTGRADGIIVIGQAGRVDRLNEAGMANKNVVVWGGAIDDHTGYTLVGSDNFEGGRLATHHLLSLGRKNILFVGDIDLPEVRLRYDGFLKAHKDMDMALNKELLLRQNFGGQTVFNAIRDLVASGENFDGVFAASDVLAMSTIHALQSLNMHIPQDISVVGYDNVGQAAFFTPGLSTIDQNISKGGEIMVDLLLKKIAGKKVESQFTPMELVVRQSCGA